VTSEALRSSMGIGFVCSRGVDAGKGRRDVEGNAVALGEHGKRISADLVGHVPVRGDAVAPTSTRSIFSEAHQVPAVLSVMSVTGIFSRIISQR